MPEPVVLVLPARDEEPTVAAVAARAPSRVGEHPVRVLVVDDGSTDATARRALAAGAEVVPCLPPGGLGAAVRVGLRAAVARGAAAVAFCDADGEYDPAELVRLVGPILTGEVDYVVGARLLARSDMLPHRRVGNRLLTAWFRRVVDVPVTDAQTGFRALSRRAAAAAEIAHDYNYAQVLTLEMVRKGFGYAEVPVSYRRRRHGRSFVRLATYLRHVVPAVHRLDRRLRARAPVAADPQSSTTCVRNRARARAHSTESTVPS